MQTKTKCGRKSRTNTQLIGRTMCIDTIKAIKSKAIDKPGHKEKCDAHDYVIRTFDRFFVWCMCIAMCVCLCFVRWIPFHSLSAHPIKCVCVSMCCTHYPIITYAQFFLWKDNYLLKRNRHFIEIWSNTWHFKHMAQIEYRIYII